MPRKLKTQSDVKAFKQLRNPLNRIFGEIIKEKRTALGMSLKEMATSMGISTGYLKNLEVGIFPFPTKYSFNFFQTLKLKEKYDNSPSISLNALLIFQGLTSSIDAMLQQRINFGKQNLTDFNIVKSYTHWFKLTCRDVVSLADASTRDKFSYLLTPFTLNSTINNKSILSHSYVQDSLVEHVMHFLIDYDSIASISNNNLNIFKSKLYSKIEDKPFNGIENTLHLSDEINAGYEYFNIDSLFFNCGIINPTEYAKKIKDIYLIVSDIFLTDLYFLDFGFIFSKNFNSFTLYIDKTRQYMTKDSLCNIIASINSKGENIKKIREKFETKVNLRFLTTDEISHIDFHKKPPLRMLAVADVVKKSSYTWIIRKETGWDFFYSDYLSFSKKFNPHRQIIGRSLTVSEVVNNIDYLKQVLKLPHIDLL